MTIIVSPAASPDELAEFRPLLDHTFSLGDPGWDRFCAVMPPENTLLARLDGELVAGLALYDMGQWFGGRRIRMAGVTSIAVAPELRGAGIARNLLTHTLIELQRQRVPIAALHPTTENVCRRVGFAAGGLWTRFVAPADQLPRGHRDPSVFPLEPSHRDALAILDRERGRLSNGNLDRNDAIWHRVLHDIDARPVQIYGVGTADGLEAYVIFTQRQEDLACEIEIKDWVATNRKAALRLWTFFADHRSMVTNLRWCGDHRDTMLLALPELPARVERCHRWMLRIVDLPRALEHRGYPPVQVELHMAVTDDILESNQDRFILRLEQGKPTVERGGRADLRLNVRTLASLYSGNHSASQLRNIGEINASPDTVAKADMLFAGPAPWMPDYF